MKATTAAARKVMVTTMRIWDLEEQLAKDIPNLEAFEEKRRHFAIMVGLSMFSEMEFATAELARMDEAMVEIRRCRYALVDLLEDLKKRLEWERYEERQAKTLF
jgi:hypothetical protein